MTARPRDHAELALLAALWGASFLFLRLGAHDFGALPLAFVRVGLATAMLLPLLLWQGHGAALRRHARPALLVGLTNSALPFACYGYAAQHLSAGLASIFNATTPLWGALIAAVWLHDRLSRSQLLGLLLGFVGVAWLASGKLVHGAAAGLPSGTGDLHEWLAMAACLGATALYGFSANFTRRHLAQVPPLALATGSQLGSTLGLLVPAALSWPAVMPSAQAWWSAVALAILCTGLAYILYFRLISHAGARYAMNVTYLIPAFAVAWGWLVLDETITATMAMACGVILVGIALSTGLWDRWRAARPAMA